MASFRSLAAVALTMLVGAREAHATVTQVSINTPVGRDASDGSTAYSCPTRTTGGCTVTGSYQGIGAADCFADTQLVIPITISTDDNGASDTGTGVLQVWAGQGDCTHGTLGCWMVASSMGSPMFGVSTPIHVRVADVVASIGQASPPQSYAPAAASSACTNPNLTSATAPTPVNLFFLWVPTQGSDVDSPGYPVMVKLAGPAAPTNVTAGVSNGSLTVTWTPPSDTTVVGYDLYAVAAPITDAAADTTELVCDGGAPDGADASCYTVTVVDTCTAPIDVSAIPCTGAGDGGPSPGICQQTPGPASATLKGLTNGLQYEVGVAAYDEYGNAGPVSTPACQTPEATVDFWQTYNQDGGSAFCALDVVGSSRGRVAAMLLGLVALMAARRRRR